MAPPERPNTIRENNQNSITVTKNPVSHARTRHIDINFHFVREALSNGCIELIYYPTEQMVADVLTKLITCNRFENYLPSIESI